MQIQKNFPLQGFNTFGLPSVAQEFVRCNSIEDVQDVIKQLHPDPLFILGGGSNILLTRDIEGLVLKMDISGKEVLHESDEDVIVRAGAGENWHEFVMYAIDNNLGGIENLSLIPGTVGAAPMQNIGAYGVEIEQVFDHLRAVDLTTGEIRTFFKEECDFGYRESIFKKEAKGKYIICDVAFRLRKFPHTLNISYGAIGDTLHQKGITNPTIRDVSNAVIEIRKSKLPDPAEIGNSGSFFKNPTISAEMFNRLKEEFNELPGYKTDDHQVKVPAAWLIEKCGWKGLVRDGIGVHKNQALVLVNYGSGKGADIEKLAFEIQASVRERFGIELQPEVNII
ncbi:UDP-N-acetylmuramate dehydrogenase [Fulvivirga sedimenti]|uniref:UDP-N-acetylenolpyruvoylglucosamine reductase n=1 Tax=Fulvivirga sedimenti TaxID=2879465 RepID=A0A9X1KVL4_9BACT|nr:UDP-N-acetylmuramate dehydrogenase [Fulvivirga sedimenti]MCA6074928.1 UDP-N-acetylmuramate dehydrogenase [Fulvivirga sedimenti]MCA6076105.1 UDP-N-acetylmuramate dehydrogenase [Fulvivirga sedimenti]MCA6077233.1 UDP-N-acetylmuramate dehydrogenase [Fulvivirga sedimenti]